MNQKIIKDRRKYERFSQANIAVCGFVEPSSTTPTIIEDITPSDINQHGIGLVTSHSLNIGDKISLAIKSSDETTSIISAIVCNRAVTDDGKNRYGLYFDYDTSQNHLRSINHMQSIAAESNQNQQSFSFSSSK